jgi:hypothetical protein
MASIDVLQQVEDRRAVRVGSFRGLRLLLAEYRRAVAAEALYEQLRNASRKAPRAQAARAVFDKFYADGADQLPRSR